MDLLHSAQLIRQPTILVDLLHSAQKAKRWNTIISDNLFLKCFPLFPSPPFGPVQTDPQEGLQYSRIEPMRNLAQLCGCGFYRVQGVVFSRENNDIQAWELATPARVTTPPPLA